jgi:thiol:disulfide interchange protein
MKISHLIRVLIAGFVLAIAPNAMAQQKHSSADVSAVLSTVNVHAGDKPTIAVIVNVHEGLHAQSHTPVDDFAIKFELKPDKSSAATFGDVIYPAGIDQTYPSLGKLNVYEGKTVIQVPVTIASDAKTGAITLTGKVRFQACNNDTCFPPENVKFSIATNVVAADQAVEHNPAFDQAVAPPVPTTGPAATQPASVAGDSDTKIFGIDLAKLAWPVIFAAAFCIGIVFNLMPCVLPVLPLKIMGFYEVSQHDRKKSLLLGAVFSAGLVASFGVLAALVVGSAKLPWGALFENFWFTVAITVVLVAMAISTFGFFTINVPTAMYSFTPRHDTYVGNFLFGILTAALSTPCTFGMFVALLAWALKQPAWIGGAAIVMVGVGMAFPYFVLSAVPEVARKFPRTGPWPEVIKQFMGFLLLATALFFAQPLFKHVSRDIFWWLMFAVVCGSGIFLVIRSIQLSGNSTPRIVCASIAILLIAPTFYAVHRITEKPFKWIPYSDQALATARASGDPVIIDFTADWCTTCHYIEAKVLHNSDVVHEINQRKVVMLQADMTNPDAAARPLLDKLNAAGAGSVPLTAVYFPNQKEPTLLKGIYSADDLKNTLAGGTQ